MKTYRTREGQRDVRKSGVIKSNESIQSVLGILPDVRRRARMDLPACEGAMLSSRFSRIYSKPECT